MLCASAARLENILHWALHVAEAVGVVLRLTLFFSSVSVVVIVRTVGAKIVLVTVFAQTTNVSALAAGYLDEQYASAGA